MPVSKKLRNQAIKIAEQYREWMKKDKHKGYWKNPRNVLRRLNTTVIPTLEGKKIDKDHIAWFLLVRGDIAVDNLLSYYRDNINIDTYRKIRMRWHRRAMNLHKRRLSIAQKKIYIFNKTLKCIRHGKKTKKGKRKVRIS